MLAPQTAALLSHTRQPQVLLAVAMLVPAGLAVSYLDVMRTMFVKSTQSGSNSITVPRDAYLPATGDVTSEQRDAAQKAAKLAEAHWAADNTNVQKAVTAMFDGGVVSHTNAPWTVEGACTLLPEVDRMLSSAPAHFCQAGSKKIFTALWTDCPTQQCSK